MSNDYIKKHVLDLLSIALDIQFHTHFPVFTVLNAQVGMLEIYIGHEMERRVDLFNFDYEARMQFNGEWEDAEFMKNYPVVKKKLESYLIIHD